jgi:hypothetical protein
MSTSKFVAIAASALVGLFSVAAQADTIPQMEQEQFGNSAQPDVDPGASRGPDESIVKQEQNQFGNDPATNFDNAPPASGGESLPQMEEQGLP